MCSIPAFRLVQYKIPEKRSLILKCHPPLTNISRHVHKSQKTWYLLVSIHRDCVICNLENSVLNGRLLSIQQRSFLIERAELRAKRFCRKYILGQDAYEADDIFLLSLHSGNYASF